MHVFLTVLLKEEKRQRVITKAAGPSIFCVRKGQTQSNKKWEKYMLDLKEKANGLLKKNSKIRVLKLL